MPILHTSLGNQSLDELRMILALEHVLVDLHTWKTPENAQAEVEDVIRLMIIWRRWKDR